MKDIPRGWFGCVDEEAYDTFAAVPRPFAGRDEYRVCLMGRLQRRLPGLDRGLTRVWEEGDAYGTGSTEGVRHAPNIAAARARCHAPPACTTTERQEVFLPFE